MSKKKTCATLPDYGGRRWACVPRRIGDTWSPTARASPHDVSNQLPDGGLFVEKMLTASRLHAKKTAKPLPHVCRCQDPVKFHHSASARAIGCAAHMFQRTKSPACSLVCISHIKKRHSSIPTKSEESEKQEKKSRIIKFWVPNPCDIKISICFTCKHLR